MDDKLTRLEVLIESLIKRCESLEERVKDKERHAQGLEDLFRGFTGEEESPATLMERLQQLEEENQSLHERIARAREGVRRLLMKIRFMEDRS